VRRAPVAVCLLVVFAASSCRNGPLASERAVGLGLTPDGDGIEVLYGLCAGARVTGLKLLLDRELATPASTSTIVGSLGARQVLWEVRSADGSELTSFIVGTAPPGFSTVVPLGRIPTDETPLLLIVSATDFPQAVLAFRRAQLETERIFMMGGNSRTPAEFRDYTNSVCHPHYA
jgi:hypothetical protein